MRRLNKLWLSILLLSFSFITFVGTTYAFVILQNEAGVEDFGFEIENATGLLISADGTHFYQDLPKSEIDKIDSERVYDGVTLDSKDGHPIIDSNNHPQFLMDSVVKDNGDRGHHELIPSDPKNYLTFDLTFRIANQGENTDPLYLYFNKLAFADQFGGDGFVMAEVQTSFPLGDRVIEAGKKFSVSPLNALRLSVVKHSDKSLMVFEPMEGMGSHAIEGVDPEVDELHSKEHNVMYNYYNSMFPLTPFTKAATPHSGFNTLDITKASNELLGTFTNDGNGYKDLTISISLWLEGWDTDFFLGIPLDYTKLKVSMGFEILKEKK